MKAETLITHKWVRSGLLEGIHINYQESPLDIPPLRKFENKQVVFTLPEANPFEPESMGMTTAEQILAVMLSKSVRRGKRSLIEPFLGPIQKIMDDAVNHQQPISFILPTLPFKDQSPFVTGATIDHVDLGEYAFFAQLKRILQSIKKIYVPGAHITLLCDGFIYADVFANNDTEGAGRYKARCEKIKNEYGLYNEVTLFDMREVLFDMPGWIEVETAIRKIIWKLYQDDTSIKERLDTLTRRFVFHVAISNVSYEEARNIYSEPIWPNHILAKLLDAAIKYSALQLTFRRTQLVKKAFPAAIRCTVHPKAAPQLPLHMTNPHNRLLPYNGVATVSRRVQSVNQSLFRSFRIKRLCEVLGHEDVVAVYAENLNLKDPIYYEIP